MSSSLKPHKKNFANINGQLKSVDKHPGESTVELKGIRNEISKSSVSTTFQMKIS